VSYRILFAFDSNCDDMTRKLSFLLLLVVAFSASLAFHSPMSLSNRQRLSTMLHAEEKQEKVKVGSNEYYSGFISSNLKDEPSERVTGDAVLGPTFKFVGGFSIILAGLLLGFMISNGLL